MESPSSKAQPPKNSQTQGRSWTPSTSYIWPGMLSMSVADASSKNSTIGAAGPQTPSTRPALCSTPDPARLAPRQQHRILDLFTSDCHVALEVTWSVYQNITPGAYRDPNKIRGKALMQTEIDRPSDAGVPSSLAEIVTLGREAQTPIQGYPGLLRSSPHEQRPHRSHQHPPRTPTRIRPRVPKPHQLQHPSTPRNRRTETPTTPPIMKSLFCCFEYRSAFIIHELCVALLHHFHI